jgi:hypothetical protein
MAQNRIDSPFSVVLARDTKFPAIRLQRTVHGAWPNRVGPNPVSAEQPVRVVPVEALVSRVEERPAEQRTDLAKVHGERGLEKRIREREGASQRRGSFRGVKQFVTVEGYTVTDLAVDDVDVLSRSIFRGLPVVSAMWLIREVVDSFRTVSRPRSEHGR